MFRLSDAAECVLTLGRCFRASYSIVSLLDAAVFADGTLSGVLCHEDSQSRVWSSTESDHAIALAAIAGRTIVETRACQSAVGGERFRRIVAASIDAVAMATPRGALEYLNPAARELLGLAPDELIYGDFTAQRSRERARNHYSARARQRRLDRRSATVHEVAGRLWCERHDRFSSGAGRRRGIYRLHDRIGRVCRRFWCASGTLPSWYNVAVRSHVWRTSMRLPDSGTATCCASRPIRCYGKQCSWVQGLLHAVADRALGTGVRYSGLSNCRVVDQQIGHGCSRPLAATMPRSRACSALSNWVCFRWPRSAGLDRRDRARGIVGMPATIGELCRQRIDQRKPEWQCCAQCQSSVTIATLPPWWNW